MRLRRVRWWRRRARRECRKGSRCLGSLAEGGNRAGESSVGIITRWTVDGGEEAMACVMDWRMEGNGFSAVRETATKLIASPPGSESRFVRSKS